MGWLQSRARVYIEHASGGFRPHDGIDSLLQPVTWKPGIGSPSSARPSIPTQQESAPFTQADIGFTRRRLSRSGAVTAIIEWKPLSHLSLGGGSGWTYLRVDGTIVTGKDVHFSQTLNRPLLTLSIPF